MKLKFPSQTITFPRRALLMGIVNINDDSFCGDGSLDLGTSLQQARAHYQNGADIIDIGAESARTNREAISIDEEISRLRFFIEQWHTIRDLEPKDEEQLSPPLLSVNTWRPEVVEQILGPEVDLLNDMSALPDNRNALLCSMSSVGHCGDNAACEGFFGVLKRDRANHRRYRTRDEARADLFDYIERFHNPRMRRRVATQDLKFSNLSKPSAEAG